VRPAWEQGDVQLYLGDCLEVLPTLEAGSVDAVVTDPPYSSGGQFRGDRVQTTISKYVQTGTMTARTDFGGDTRDQRSFFAWCTLWLSAAFHAADGGGVVACFVDWRQLPVMTDAIQAGGWTWRNIATWWKPGCRMQRGRFSSSAEYILYGTKGSHGSDGEESPQNVFACPTLTGNGKNHIAEKPMEVMAWIIGVTRPGGTILDPFMGSGTTGVACVKTGRKFIGIEIDPGYFEIAKKRISEAQMQPRLL